VCGLEGEKDYSIEREGMSVCVKRRERVGVGVVPGGGGRRGTGVPGGREGGCCPSGRQGMKKWGKLCTPPAPPEPENLPSSSKFVRRFCGDPVKSAGSPARHILTHVVNKVLLLCLPPFRSSAVAARPQLSVLASQALSQLSNQTRNPKNVHWCFLELST
jgi:hypothetical protein